MGGDSLDVERDGVIDVRYGGRINLKPGAQLQVDGVDVTAVLLGGGPSSPGAVVWGDIGGTLSSQTDLASALAAKAASSHGHVIADSTGLQAALDAKSDASHGHASTAITDSTSTGRAVLTSADAPAARAAIGAGTSSFSGAYTDLSGKPTLGDSAAKNVGTTAGTVAAGDHTHAAGVTLAEVIAAIYPVGCLKFSADNVNPGTYLAGTTWALWGPGRVLVCFDSNDTQFDAAEETSGAKTVAAAGSVSQPTFTGSSASTSAVSAGTPAGTVAAPTFTGDVVSSTAVSAGTPAGTNSVPTFTGSPLATHAHELPFQIPTTTTTRQIAAATFGSGTSRAATAVSAAGTGNTTSAAVALSEAKSAGTPAGTVTAPVFTGSALGTHQHSVTPSGTVSAPAFTGSALGTHQHTVTATGTVSQPSFTGSATSVVQPSIVGFMWKRTA